MLQVDLHGDAVRAVQGSMVAYTGAVEFRSAGLGGGDGFRAALKRKAAGESLALMECTGTGTVHLAVDAQYVRSSTSTATRCRWSRSRCSR